MLLWWCFGINKSSCKILSTDIIKRYFTGVDLHRYSSTSHSSKQIIWTKFDNKWGRKLWLGELFWRVIKGRNLKRKFSYRKIITDKVREYRLPYSPSYKVSHYFRRFTQWPFYLQQRKRLHPINTDIFGVACIRILKIRTIHFHFS